MTRPTIRRGGPAVALAAILASACGSASLPSSVVVGRYPSAPPDLWERSVSALRAAGYAPVAADAARGTLAVTSRARPSSYAGARFELQLYREGWVQLKVAGPVVTRAGAGHLRVPADVAQEFDALVVELARRLGPSGEPAPGARGEASEAETSGGDPFGGATSGGAASGAATSGGSTPGGDASGSDGSGGDAPGGDASGGDTSEGETSGGETSGGDPIGGETSGGDPIGGATSGGDAS